MLKAKKYNIAETNIAFLGTELEKKIKAAAAGKEKQWEGAGKAPGLQVWRIEKFQVVPWPKDQYGKFYTDDSYIVLNTYKRGTAFAHNVHFWLGETTSQDEAGTAAYKTVELDDVLGGVPVQYREVQGYESDAFVALFKPNGIRLLSGGVSTGFRNVKPHEYKPRLLHVKGNKKNVRCIQVPLSRDSLNDGDVFLLDTGMVLYQWQPEGASVAEKAKAAQVARAIDDERGSKVDIKVLEAGTSDEDSEAFWKLMGGKGAVKSKAEGGDDATAESHRVLLRLKIEDSDISFDKIAEDKIAKKLLTSDDVYVLDTGAEIFAWVGKKASKDERKLALGYAQKYLQDSGRPAYLSVCRIFEGGENEIFNAAFTS